MALVQSKLTEGTGVTSLTITPTSATTAGNLLILCISIEQTATVSTITPPSGWSTTLSHDRGASSCEFVLAYKENASSVSSMQVTFSAAVDVEVDFHEHSGMATSGALDKTAQGTGTGTAAASGNTATTAQANELVIGVITSSTAATHDSYSPAGWTLSSNEASNAGTAADRVRQSVNYKIVSATGAYNIDCTLGSSREWIASIATFKIGGGVTLAINDSTHGHAADSAALTQANSLAVADSGHHC